MIDERGPMRLFVGVSVPDAAIAAAEEVVRALQGCLPPAVKARWVPAANMHLTVTFIGNVRDERLAEMLDVLRPPLAIAPFEVELGSCGVFPRTGAPRVIWIGLSEGSAALKAMHEEFDRRLAPLGVASETRDFSVHLTLARIKDAPAGSGSKARQCAVMARPTAMRWRVTAATVFQSLLSPKGPTYRPVFEIPCAG